MNGWDYLCRGRLPIVSPDPWAYLLMSHHPLLPKLEWEELVRAGGGVALLLSNASAGQSDHPRKYVKKRRYSHPVGMVEERVSGKTSVSAVGRLEPDWILGQYHDKV